MTAAETARAVGLTERQLVTFHLGNEEFGADIMNVREIIRFAEVTKIPQAPDYVEGVCNLRGSILPIIDGRTRFGMDRGQRDENTRVLVVDVSGQVTGIVVDRVSEVLRVAGADIDPPPAVIRNEAVRYLDGVVKLNGGKRLIMALNLEQALTVESENRDFDLQTAAAAAVREVAAQRAELEEDQLVTFLLGQEEYAFDIMHVKEIIRVPEITAVPNVLHYLEGVVSIRNQLLPIVNMRLYFNMPNVPVTDQSRIIIVDLGQMTAGFRVDRVLEVIRVPRSVIEPPPPIFINGELEQIRGVAKLNEGKRLFMCLNAANLLDADLVSDLLERGESNVVRENQSSSGAIEEEQLVAFRLGKEEFAIKITDVQEINRMTQVTQMPGAPGYVEGLVNLRGNIIPALNLRRRFGMTERTHDDATRIIIVDVGLRKTGIIVDAVTEVLRFERSLVEETPRLLSETVDREYISGVAKLSGGKRMVMILDSERILKIEG
ncbi:chemotaxis protein [Heliobacterium undosum]|uniref:Chemotaxis protein n=1 Tax=Heliomicrobium undosum TaxID=121734 RepID=A0A845L230_9FIRM|nr:chemotaxis protein CheW [Heliomicrobium undosum]MZP30293.1 chemotaxis protein [Heliomicrobium undosum]